MLFYQNFGDLNPPYPALGSNIPSARRQGQRFHFLQCRGSSPSLRFVNRHGGTLRRAGWVAFTKTYSRGKWLISHLPPTFAIIIPIPRPPASLYLTSPRRRPSSQVPLSRPSSLKSLVSRPQVPSPKSPHARSDVPVPLSPSHFYTQPSTCKLNLRHTWKNTAVQFVGKNLVRQKELAWNLYTVWHKFLENTKQPTSSSFLTYFMISVTDANLWLMLKCKHTLINYSWIIQKRRERSRKSGDA